MTTKYGLQVFNSNEELILDPEDNISRVYHVIDIDPTEYTDWMTTVNIPWPEGIDEYNMWSRMEIITFAIEPCVDGKMRYDARMRDEFDWETWQTKLYIDIYTSALDEVIDSVSYPVFTNARSIVVLFGR